MILEETRNKGQSPANLVRGLRTFIASDPEAIAREKAELAAIIVSAASSYYYLYLLLCEEQNYA